MILLLNSFVKISCIKNWNIIKNRAGCTVMYISLNSNVSVFKHRKKMKHYRQEKK